MMTSGEVENVANVQCNKEDSKSLSGNIKI
jgi:hypothetical protein